MEMLSGLIAKETIVSCVMWLMDELKYVYI